MIRYCFAGDPAHRLAQQSDWKCPKCSRQNTCKDGDCRGRRCTTPRPSPTRSLPNDNKWFLRFDVFRTLCRERFDVGGTAMSNDSIEELTTYLRRLGAILVSAPPTTPPEQRWVVLNITNFVNAMHKGTCMCVCLCCITAMV